MTLTWYGLSSFKISNTGGEVTVVTDPFHKDSGLTPPRGAADIVLISKNDELHSFTEGITGEPLIIDNAGEFDIKGVHIRGISPLSINDKNPNGSEDGQPTTIYQIEMDGVRMAFLGAFGSKELSDHQVEELGNIDVLLVPVGGNHGVVNWEAAANIVNQIEPRFIVPCYYKQEGSIFDLDEPAKFLKEVGGENRTEDRLTLKQKDVMVETTSVVLLNPQR